MELKERIATYNKSKYNQWYWWRRFKPRETLHKYMRLNQRIPNGDFEVSDYHWQIQYEHKLEKEALANIKDVTEYHETKCLFGERRRRLINDFEKDEAKILEEMYKAFWTELRMTKEDVENKMLEFDGTLAEFYEYIYLK
jgi:hypothetical protein